MMMDKIVALAVEALGAVRQSIVKEVYANQRMLRRSRNGQIVVGHQNNSNGKGQQES